MKKNKFQLLLDFFPQTVVYLEPAGELQSPLPQNNTSSSIHTSLKANY